MDEQDQILAIAAAEGWYPTPHGNWTRSPTGRGTPEFITYFELPKYTRSLDAMHEAEKVLLPQQWWEWEHIVAKMFVDRGSRPLSVCVAKMTSSQRAEAFLRTIGKWKN